MTLVLIMRQNMMSLTDIWCWFSIFCYLSFKFDSNLESYFYIIHEVHNNKLILAFEKNNLSDVCSIEIFYCQLIHDTVGMILLIQIDDILKYWVRFRKLKSVKELTWNAPKILLRISCKTTPNIQFNHLLYGTGWFDIHKENGIALFDWAF